MASQLPQIDVLLLYRLVQVLASLSEGEVSFQLLQKSQGPQRDLLVHIDRTITRRLQTLTSSSTPWWTRFQMWKQEFNSLTSSMLDSWVMPKSSRYILVSFIAWIHFGHFKKQIVCFQKHSPLLVLYGLWNFGRNMEFKSNLKVPFILWTWTYDSKTGCSFFTRSRSFVALVRRTAGKLHGRIFIRV